MQLTGLFRTLSNERLPDGIQQELDTLDQAIDQSQDEIDTAFHDLIDQIKNSDPLLEDRSSKMPVLVGLSGFEPLTLGRSDCWPEFEERRSGT